MPIYLSSYGLGSPPAAVHAATAGARAAVVMNALDQFGPSRTRDLGLEVDALATIGYVASELDLRDYIGADADLVHALEAVDLVWVVGGNSFVLARAMTRCGFRDAVLPALARPGFVYAGYSAGSVVAGPDLAGIDLVDDPDVLAPGETDRVEAATLGLIPFRVVPHWRSDHPESPAIDRVAEHLGRSGLEHRCLHDGEALLVDGDEVSLVGGPGA